MTFSSVVTFWVGVSVGRAFITIYTEVQKLISDRKLFKNVLWEYCSYSVWTLIKKLGVKTGFQTHKKEKQHSIPHDQFPETLFLGATDLDMKLEVAHPETKEDDGREDMGCSLRSLTSAVAAWAADGTKLSLNPHEEIAPKNKHVMKRSSCFIHFLFEKYGCNKKSTHPMKTTQLGMAFKPFCNWRRRSWGLQIKWSRTLTEEVFFLASSSPTSKA